VVADTATITDWRFVDPADLPVIASPIDLLGVNYYQPTLVAAAEHPRPSNRPTPWPGCEGVEFRRPSGSVTSMDWPVDASALRDLLVRLHRDYDIPVAVTENGAAYDDVVTDAGAVHDVERIAYLRDHLAAVHEAIRAGVPVRGYFVWSLMDNFEWSMGYSKRFGLVHIDYGTQRRTVKDSGWWYRDVIASGGVPAG
jgi:beta-glucosidase